LSRSIKLLALDLDGTVLDSRGNIPAQNRRAIREAEEAGVLVTIATGRRFRDARPLGIELELNAPLITHNGALLKFAESLETVEFSLLKSEVSSEIIRVGKKYGGDALLSADPHGKGTLLYDRVSRDNIPLQRYIQWAKSMHGDEAEEAVHHVSSLESALHDHEVIHISFSGGCEPMAALQQVLAQELGETITLLATVYPHLDFTLLDLLPHNASKGTGLEQLAARHGITREEVMAIGDNFNDLEMLEFAGTPVVMGNADPGLLERPDLIPTASNDESGVARAIERFILSAG
jgi:5-amino-6-(5-phospho-D-ribitylamino)uracil phosphatase